MRKIYVLLVIVLLSACITQSGWGVDQWKNHLAFMTPPLGGDATSMVTGFAAKDLPPGTHIVYDIQSQGTLQGADTQADTTVGITIAGTEQVDTTECTVMDITIDMTMQSQGSTLTMQIQGKEWVDEKGVPVKIEETAEMGFGEYKIPLSLNMKREKEEVYNGHDCWVFKGSQTIDVLGVSTGGEITEYIDKKTAYPIRVITTVGEEQVDTGYMEPPVMPEELEWELGERESVTTPAGTYDCQIIYLKKDGKVVGTVWANENVKVPIKYIYTYTAENTNVDVTMILQEYTLG